ncbi:Isoliquiritigenin 2'-O-methyltransferase [Arachis hypogaea]|nr:Isoliquiritigenin 2'-O-methyltransferase [Arachis hypogaea]
MMSSSARKEEEYDDDDACMYALLLSTFQVFPFILNAAVELNLFEILSELAPNGAYSSVSEIASKFPSQHPQLHNRLDRMLRVLASFSLLNSSVVVVDGDKVERLYSLSHAAKYFLKNQSHNLAFFSNLNCHPALTRVWVNIKDAIADGGTEIFKKVNGMSVWEYMEKDAELSDTFNKAMAGMSTLVDVGGGTGHCLKMILSKYPNIKGINFDLPQVIQHAPPYPGIVHVGGNMHETIPKGDAIMIKAVCHNWSDEKCVTVLKNCYKALEENGKVIIFEMIMPEEPDSSNASKLVSVVDNSMLLHAGGKERTEKEFGKLCKDSGFTTYQVVCRTLSVFGVIEFYK